jgi:hypothetical protein
LKQPYCRFCGGKIPKRTRYTNLRSQEQAKRGIGGSDWITVAQLPRSSEELARITNHQVTKAYADYDGNISAFNSWDGESYDFRHGHFCKIDCAARFGREMADRGARR